MNILLDTHIALWALADDPSMPAKARNLLLDPENTLYYSTVSTWEVLLKQRSAHNNLNLDPEHFVSYCREAGFIPLPISDRHICAAATLVWHGKGNEHNDPFDRLLIAQAKAENFSLLTHDERIPFFDEKCILAV